MYGSVRNLIGVMRLLAMTPSGVFWTAAGADTTTADYVYKEIFEPEISEGVDNEFPLREFFEEIDATEDWKGGRGTRWSIHTKRNTSPFFTREGAMMARAGRQGGAQGMITQCKLTARVRMTAEVMMDTMSSEGALRSQKKDELQRTIDDISWREEGALGMDGRGILAMINAGPANANPLALKNPGNITGADFGNRFIQIGMSLAAVNPVGNVLRAGIAEVSDVSSDGTTITPTANWPGAWANGDYLIQAANASVTDLMDTSFEAAYWGLPALIDDGTNRDNYFGVLRSLTPAAKSYINASTGSLSSDLLQRLADIVYQKLGGKANLLACHPSIRRLILQMTDADRRYSGENLMSPNPGTVAFNQGDLDMGPAAKIKAIRSMPLAQLYIMDTKRIGAKRYVSENGKWVDEDGAIWQRDYSGDTSTHSFEAWYFRRQQYFFQNPGMGAVASGITGQTLVVVRSE